MSKTLFFLSSFLLGLSGLSQVQPASPSWIVNSNQYTNRLLEVEMKQRGLPVELYNHTSWNAVADKLIEDYKANKNVAPIIIVGHSLGADAALVLANWLIDHNVPVRLVVTLDGVGEVATMVGGSAEVINYYKPHQFGQEVVSTHGFKGKITNIDLSDHPEIGHLNIDKNQMIHDDIITKVLEIMKKKPAVTAKG